MDQKSRDKLVRYSAQGLPRMSQDVGHALFSSRGL